MTMLESFKSTLSIGLLLCSSLVFSQAQEVESFEVSDDVVT